MELNDYLRVFRRHWFGICLIAVLAVAGAGGLSLRQEKVYAANASGFVSTGSTQDPSEASIGDTLAKSRATSYVDLAESRVVAQNAARALQLNVDPAALIGRIDVVQPVDTVLIRITAKASTPRGAQDLADAWVAALADQVAAVENPTGQGNSLKVVPIESAELPSAPISPNVKRNLMLGLVLGVLLGGAYAVTRSQLDRRVNSAETVERDFGVPAVAAIPSEASIARDRSGRATMATEGRQDSRGKIQAREAFLKLRTNLQFMHPDDPPRVLVVTSPLPADGKSTIAANLASALSVNGQQVVLVDGDMRKPTVAETFGVLEGPGLTDLIIGSAKIDDVLQNVSDLPNLWILSAGRIPPNPSELLGSEAMKRLLTALSEHFMVVVDAPPLLPVTDAAVLAARADGTLVVISANKTLDSQLRDSLALIEAVHGHTLGVVFNRVSKRDSASGYYGNYYGPDNAPVKPKDVKKPGGRRSARDHRSDSTQAQVGK